MGDDAAVNDIVDKALEINVKGKLFVDCSTVHPKTSNDIGQKLAEKGAEFVACPGELT